MTLERQIELLAEPPKSPGIALAVIASVIVHSALLLFMWLKRPEVGRPPDPSLVRFVELMRQPAFVEAPGPKVESAPLTAPYSNADRRASSPVATGAERTNRPGSEGFYVPGSGRAGREASEAPVEQSDPSNGQEQPVATSSSAPLRPSDSNSPRTIAGGTSIDWNSAIREVGKVASLGGDGLGNAGGEEGFAESGPISFESQWYDWGEYADAMVRRIRRNWYANMPPLIRMGMKGVVTIQFTIQRSGTLTDITVVKSSEVPPYDYAAKKALELSSPLQPLPADFPNRSERVTAQFYYNLHPKPR